jgi:hypothetical protein
MLGLQFIPLDFASGLGVTGVKVQSVLARKQAHHLINVGP